MTTDASRRAFLQRTSLLSMAGIAAPWAINLAAMGEATASTAADYKALVCIFLYGGNDYGNTLIPYDNTRYALYQGMRPTLAYAQAALAPTLLVPTTALSNGMQYALAPELAPLLPLFTSNAMAVMLNVGTLVEPTTKAQYTAKSVALPPKLFSHNDQQSVWQSSSPEGATSGWVAAWATCSSPGTAMPRSPASMYRATRCSCPDTRRCSTRSRQPDRSR